MNVCRLVRIVFIAMPMMSGFSPALFAAELPVNSVYRLNVALENHRGEATPFSELQGHVTIASMFYGSCPHVCPMLIATVQQIERQIPEEARAALRVAMVTIDPERDTPEHLGEIAARHGVDSERWTLARTAPGNTRALAAVFGIKYKALPDGGFNHTTAIILLDAQGRELARTDRLGLPDPEFMRTLAKTLAAN